MNDRLTGFIFSATPDRIFFVLKSTDEGAIATADLSVPYARKVVEQLKWCIAIAAGEDAETPPDVTESQLAEKDAEISRLREALKPFAALADAFDGRGDEGAEFGWRDTRVTLRDLRRARDARGGST